MNTLIKLLIIVFLFCFGMHTTHAQETDPKAYQFMEGELGPKSQLNQDGMYYEYLPIRMAAGDIVLIKYESTEFVVGMLIADTLGHKVQKQDDSMFFKLLGSKLEIPYHATVDGQINFVFTSRSPGTTGKFKLQIFYYTKQLDNMNDYSPFCDKLLYIASNAPSKFEFLKKPYRLEGHSDFFEPSLILDPIPNVRNKIQTTIGARYYVDYPETKNLDSLMKQFDDLEANLTECLVNHKKETREKGKEGDFYQLIRGVSYTISGKDDKETTMLKALGREVKYTIKLSLEKTSIKDNTYRIEISID